MKADKILLSGIASTSVMTLFSYLVSDVRKVNFKEPELLAHLLQDMMPGAEKEFALPAGWFTHYSMGTIWPLVHDFLLKKSGMAAHVKSGLLLGAFSGLTGVLIWKLVFRMHPNPPRIPYKNFYGHLFLAHLIYSITVVLIRGNDKNTVSVNLNTVKQ